MTPVSFVLSDVKGIGTFRNTGFANSVLSPRKFYRITNKFSVTKEGAIHTLFIVTSVQYQFHLDRINTHNGQYIIRTVLERVLYPVDLLKELEHQQVKLVSCSCWSSCRSQRSRGGHILHR